MCWAYKVGSENLKQSTIYAQSCVLQSQYPATSQLNTRTTKRRGRPHVSVKPCHSIRVALFPRQRALRREGWLRRGDRRGHARRRRPGVASGGLTPPTLFRTFPPATRQGPGTRGVKPRGPIPLSGSAFFGPRRGRTGRPGQMAAAPAPPQQWWRDPTDWLTHGRRSHGNGVAVATSWLGGC